MSCRLVRCTPFCVNSSGRRPECVAGCRTGAWPRSHHTDYRLVSSRSSTYQSLSKWGVPMRILISGASIAGPVLAYWLSHRASTSRWSNAHPHCVRPVATLSTSSGLPWRSPSEWACCPGHVARDRDTVLRSTALGVGRPDRLPQAQQGDVRPTCRDHARRPQRDLLRRLARRRRVLFGDEITAISDDGDVMFERAAPGSSTSSSAPTACIRECAARFRRRRPRRFLGGYLAVLSVPKSLAHEGEMGGY